MKYIKIDVQRIQHTSVYVEVPDDYELEDVIADICIDDAVCETTKNHDWDWPEYDIDNWEETNAATAKQYTTYTYEG